MYMQKFFSITIITEIFKLFNYKTKKHYVKRNSIIMLLQFSHRRIFFKHVFNKIYTSVNKIIKSTFYLYANAYKQFIFNYIKIINPVT